MVLGRIDAYDMFGNRIVTTDALGNTVFKSYDPFGRVVAEWGATYPVRFTYDTQGRRTSLSTTRDGIAWDTTTWAYDPRTSLCLSKTYADGSSVTYTYTPDNLLLRTTYASGRWRENTYDTSRCLVADGHSGIAKVTNSKSLNHATSPKIKAFGKTVTVFKNSGRICFVAGIGMSLVDIYRADNRVREVVRQVGGWSGAALGGKLGASLGTSGGMTAAIALGQMGPQIATPEELVTVPVFGFIGGVGGGIVGGISGFFLGAKTTEKIYDWAFTPLEKEEWEVGCEQY